MMGNMGGTRKEPRKEAWVLILQGREQRWEVSFQNWIDTSVGASNKAEELVDTTINQLIAQNSTETIKDRKLHKKSNLWLLIWDVSKQVS